jgi:hypothetical protein
VIVWSDNSKTRSSVNPFRALGELLAVVRWFVVPRRTGNKQAAHPSPQV